MNEQITETKDKELQQREERIEQLKTMESWGQSQGDDLVEQKRVFSDNVIVFQTRYDEEKIAQMRSMAPHAEVTGTAPVPEPPIQAPAAKEGYKARREREKKRKEALKVCPVGDEYTLDIAREIKAGNESLQASITPEITERAQATHSDMRALKVFCSEFQLDKKGRPATEEDARIMRENQEFMMFYTSGSKKLRKPFLDRFTDQMLSTKLTPDMFTEENLTKHAAEYKQLGDRFTYFENLQKENPEYFDSLPELKKELLAAQLQAGVAFTTAFAQHMNARGINFNVGEVYSEMTPIEMGLASRDMLTDEYRHALESQRTSISGACQAEADRMAEKELAELRPAYAQQDEQLKREYGVSFPGGASELQYSDLKKYRDMIADHNVEYQENKELIDAVFSDYYKVLSEIGEKTLLVRAHQGVVDDNNDQFDTTHRAIMLSALNKSEQTAGTITTLSHYGNALMDIMEHLLRGKKLPEEAEARVVLERYRNKLASAKESD